MPSETAKTDGAIIVADTNKNKKWHNDKNWDNWNNKRSSWSGPAEMVQVALLRDRRRWRGARSGVSSGRLCSRTAGAESLLVLGPIQAQMQGYWDYCY